MLKSSSPGCLSASFHPRGIVCIGPDVASSNYREDGRGRSAFGPDVVIKLWGKGRWTGKNAIRTAGYVISPKDMLNIFRVGASNTKSLRAYMRRKRRAEVHVKRTETEG
ncbi:MAG: hypothetical protein RLZZ347_250 [Candidatus Parcubacteria bacterium]|jgi:hypothetical protein